MFTSAIHAAAPHNDKMNMRFSWEGYALPNPPCWRVVSWEGCALPNPPGGEGCRPTGRGMGKPGFPISQPLLGAAGAPQAGGWENPVSPYVHLSRPAAPLRTRGA